MSWLKRLIHGVPREPESPPTVFETGWRIEREVAIPIGLF